jgi:hypothetical protein
VADRGAPVQVVPSDNFAEKSCQFEQLVSVPKRLLALVMAIVGMVPHLRAQARAEYVGGTASTLDSGNTGSIELGDEHYLAFYCKHAQVRVRYDQINLIEYGQKVDRRLAMAVIISPVFLLSKKRQHFLTLGYADDDGKQQALVFRVDKNGIRPALVGLEARTGLKVQYQDEEARKAGRG